WEVKNPESIPVFARRAFKTASTAPGGPVYVCFGRNALETNVKAEIWPAETFSIQARPRPSKESAERLAKQLVEAQRPVAVFGDEVWKSGAQADAVALAEMVGLAAAAPGPLGRLASLAFVNFPVHHPQFVGEYLTAKPFGAAKPDLLVEIGMRGDMG